MRVPSPQPSAAPLWLVSSASLRCRVKLKQKTNYRVHCAKEPSQDVQKGFVIICSLTDHFWLWRTMKPQHWHSQTPCLLSPFQCYVFDKLFSDYSWLRWKRNGGRDHKRKDNKLQVSCVDEMTEKEQGKAEKERRLFGLFQKKSYDRIRRSENFFTKKNMESRDSSGLFLRVCSLGFRSGGEVGSSFGWSDQEDHN